MTGAIRHTIAVVDDDYRILESLESLLESAGLIVRLFPSAEAFLKAAILPTIDCLISDIGMPDMDGYDLLQLVLLQRPELPVFLITGREETVRLEYGDVLPACHLFLKPFDGKKLLSVVTGSLRENSL